MYEMTKCDPWVYQDDGLYHDSISGYTLTMLSASDAHDAALPNM